jgi:hypothetical protein
MGNPASGLNGGNAVKPVMLDGAPGEASGSGGGFMILEVRREDKEADGGGGA